MPERERRGPGILNSGYTIKSALSGKSIIVRLVFKA